MSRPRPQVAALCVGAALLAVVGCGSEEDEEPRPGIPAQAAEQLSRELDLVQRRIDVTREQSAPGACEDVESKSHPDIQEILDGLPQDTDPDVRRALEQGIERLKELTGSECSRLVEEIEKRREETAPQVTPPPAPVQPETPPQETQTEEEKPEEDKKKKKEEEKPKKEEGNGGLGPNGQGPPGQNGGGQPAPAPQDG